MSKDKLRRMPLEVAAGFLALTGLIGLYANENYELTDRLTGMSDKEEVIAADLERFAASHGRLGADVIVDCGYSMFENLTNGDQNGFVAEHGEVINLKGTVCDTYGNKVNFRSAVLAAGAVAEVAAYSVYDVESPVCAEQVAAELTPTIVLKDFYLSYDRNYVDAILAEDNSSNPETCDEDLDGLLAA